MLKNFRRSSVRCMKSRARTHSLSLTLLLAALFIFLPARAQAQQGTLTDDAQTSAGKPNKNLGSDDAIQVSASGDKGFLKFKLTQSLPLGTIGNHVGKATLKLFVGGVAAPGVIEVRTVAGAWSEAIVTDASSPALGPVIGTISITADQAGKWVTFDLTQTVKNWLDGASPNNGIVLTPVVAGGASVTFDSKENRQTSHEPRLEVVLNHAATADTATTATTADAAATLTNVLPVNKGGTGLNAAGAVGNVLRSNGAQWTSAPLQAADFPGLANSFIQNQNAATQTANFNINGNGTAGGTISGNVVNATTQYSLGGAHILSSNFPNQNTFAGRNAGQANQGLYNSFFGTFAGAANTTGAANSFFGDTAGTKNTLGYSNSFFGSGAGYENVQGTDNAFFGFHAGFINTASFNSFFGSQAGSANTTGNGNSFFGVSSGSANTSGSNNNFFGQRAGSKNKDGVDNNFFGVGAGLQNVSGVGNSFFGNEAGINNQGNGNSFFGESAGRVNVTGRNNTALGRFAGVSASALNFATAIGANAIVSTSDTIVLGKVAGTYNGEARPADTVQIPGNLTVNGAASYNIVNAQTQYNLGGQRVLGIVGTQNTFVGLNAGASNAACCNSFFGFNAGVVNAAGDNSFFGNNAGVSNTTGTRNSFFGSVAGYSNQTGSDNAFFGVNAGRNNTASFNSFFGSGAGRANAGGGGNAFFGYESGIANDLGTYNAFFGMLSGHSNTSGSLNSFFGRDAGYYNTTGSYNSFFGDASGLSNQTGTGNAFFGRSSGQLSTGNRNTFVGAYAGYSASNIGVTTGSNNTFVGNLSGQGVATGSGNTFLGYNTTGAANLMNATAIGAGASVTTDNTVVLGRSADTVRIPGNLNVAGNFTANFTVPASNITGVMSVSNGGTGLSAPGAGGNFLRSNGATWTSSAIQTADVPNLDASKITTGTFNAAQIPNLDAGKITTGTFTVSLIPNLDASKITTGTFADARLSTNVATLSGAQTFTGAKTFSGGINGDGAGLTNLNASNIASGTLDNARLGVVPVGKGGTGLNTAGTSGNFLRSDGAQWSSAPLTAADIPAGSANYVQSNPAAQQAGVSFNVGGNGTVGGTLTANSLNVVGSFSAASFSGNGSNLTNLNAGNITSGTLDNARLGQITTANIAENVVTAPKIASGQVVKSLNGLNDNVTLAAGANITITPAGNTLTISASGGGGCGGGGTCTADIFNANTQYNLGGLRFLSSSPADSGNIFLGFGVGNSTVSGNNTVVGNSAGAGTVGGMNSVFGKFAGASNENGSANVFMGFNTGFSNRSGSYNTFLGSSTGSGANTGVGNATGSNVTLVGARTDVGSDGLAFASAIGARSTVNTSDTIVLGKVAGDYDGAARPADTVVIPGNLIVAGTINGGSGGGGGGSDNAILNQTAQQSGANFNIDGTGKANIFDAKTQYNLGGNRFLAEANSNLSVGLGAAQPQFNFMGNSFFGDSAAGNLNNGGGNTSIGYQSSGNIAQATFNTAVGAYANNRGQNGGGYNTFLGAGAAAITPGLFFATAIGASAVVSTSDTIVLGKELGVGGRDADTVIIPGNLIVNGTFTNPSDARLKTGIATLHYGLSELMRLRPVTWTWKDRPGGKASLGLIAQDVRPILPELIEQGKDKDKTLSMNYLGLLPVMIRATQQQQEQIKQQQDEIQKQREQLSRQQNLIESLKRLVCQDHPNAEVCR